MSKVAKEQIGILIAVRMKSSRLRSKAMAKIVGKPVIAHLIERMKQSKRAGKIVLCTSTHPDDAVLLDVAKQQGIPSFAGSELDVMKRFIDAAEKYDLKVVVRVTGDNPLTDPENVDAMIDVHLKGGYDFTKSEFLPIGMNAEIISLTTLKRAYATAEDTSLTEYMTTYLKRPDIFKIYSYKSKDPFFENRSLIRLTVDYEADLKVMNEIYSALYPKNRNFTASEIIAFIDANPHLMKINADVYQIPLPKIRFKGEKSYDKKLLLVGDDMRGPTKAIVKALKKIDEYELTGFVHDTNDIELSLVDGIPVLGRCTQFDSIKTDAQYFFTTFADAEKRQHYGKILAKRGLKPINILASSVSAGQLGKGVFLGDGVKVGTGVTLGDNVHIMGAVKIPARSVIPANSTVRKQTELVSVGKAATKARKKSA